MSAEAANALPHIEVACGVLVDERGRVLIVQRPKGKIAEFKWEFPGGKIEDGESAREALDRELVEEIGIRPSQAHRLHCFTHAYHDRVVTLHCYRVDRWEGAVRAVEGQRFEWHSPEQDPQLDVLPTVAPILAAMRLPTDYVFTPPDADSGYILEQLPRLPRGALLRLRLPQLPEVTYRQLAERVIERAPRQRLRVLLDRGPDMARALGAAGCHIPQDGIAAATNVDDAGLRIASCHDAESLAQARAAGFDAAVLGPVRATPTHPGMEALGWDRFAALARQANLPLYAIGGVGPDTLNAAQAYLARGVAGIRAYWSRSRA